MARLLVVATPIGNLNDLTPRMREALACADLIAAEVGRGREVVQKLSQRVVAGKRLPVGAVAIHAHSPQAQRKREQDDEQYGEEVYLLTHVPLSLP